jgi:hypothetical protein
VPVAGLQGEIARGLSGRDLSDPRVKLLLSDEHFSVDGTLIEAWASRKSFRPKDGSGEPPTPGRTTGHVGYAASLRMRKRIEEVFGWIGTVGGLRKTRHRRVARVAAAYK